METSLDAMILTYKKSKRVKLAFNDSLLSIDVVSQSSLILQLCFIFPCLLYFQVLTQQHFFQKLPKPPIIPYEFIIMIQII